MTPAEIVAALTAYREELSEILARFNRTRDRIFIDQQDNFRLRGLVTEVIDLLRDHVPGSAQHIRLIGNSYNEGVGNFYNSSSYASVEEIRATVQAVITRVERNPGLFGEAAGAVDLRDATQELLTALDKVIVRFHAVAVQLRSRYSERPTLDINDEYDVQDLLHALLRIYFDDVRPEEWVPSYAGGASRTDFLLPQVNTVIEVKKTRAGLHARSLGEQLIIDIAKYRRHPQCRRLICFVYDPEGRIANPAGIEADLNNSGDGIDVTVYILPKAA